MNSLTFLSAAKEPWHAGGRGKKKKKQRRRESKQIAVKKRDGGGRAGGEVGGGARAGQQEGCIGPSHPQGGTLSFQFANVLSFIFLLRKKKKNQTQSCVELELLEISSISSSLQGCSGGPP